MDRNGQVAVLRTGLWKDTELSPGTDGQKERVKMDSRAAWLDRAVSLASMNSVLACTSLC